MQHTPLYKLCLLSKKACIPRIMYLIVGRGDVDNGDGDHTRDCPFCLTRPGSVNSQMHKRVSCVIAKESTVPTSMSVPPT